MSVPRFSFLQRMIDKYKLLLYTKPDTVHSQKCAEVFVRKFVEYYSDLHDNDVKEGKERPTSGLTSAQNYLSTFKMHLARELNAPPEFLKHLH